MSALPVTDDSIICMRCTRANGCRLSRTRLAFSTRRPFFLVIESFLVADFHSVYFIVPSPHLSSSPFFVCVLACFLGAAYRSAAHHCRTLNRMRFRTLPVRVICSYSNWAWRFRWLKRGNKREEHKESAKNDSLPLEQSAIFYSSAVLQEPSYYWLLS